MNILLSPPLAFLIYVPLVVLILMLGKSLAGPEKSKLRQSSLYASGEKAPTSLAAPGYRPFFIIAFFFAILHLGMLVLGSSPLNLKSGIYLGGLIIALLALILG
jgi:NADH:ubiquinone oxidoreductase subunit 3 (subunit A)